MPQVFIHWLVSSSMVPPGFLLLLNPLFSGFFDIISILQNVEKSVDNLPVIDAVNSLQF